MPAVSPSVDANLDRGRVYRALARLFELPATSTLEALGERELPELLEALVRLEAEPALVDAARAVNACLGDTSLERLERAYQQTFEPSGGLRCAPNETFHTAETGSQEVTRTYELADVSGFYHAFGVEVAPGTERADHISAELEFMHLLAVKEALARAEQGSDEHAEICHDAARAFLRDHLGRWASRLGERLEEAASDPLYAAAGRLLGRFVDFDAVRLGAVARPASA